MIFDRKVYRRINFFIAFKKRFSIFNLGKNTYKPQSLEILYPSLVKEIDTQRLEFLNKYCHTNAFTLKYKRIYLELSKCNACMECKKFDGIVFSKVGDLNKLIDGSFLPLDR